MHAPRHRKRALQRCRKRQAQAGKRKFTCATCPLNDAFFRRCLQGPTQHHHPLPPAPTFTGPRGTAASTVDAFWHVVKTYDDAYVNRWLNEHPRDKAYLLDLYRREKKKRRGS